MFFCMFSRLPLVNLAVFEVFCSQWGFNHSCALLLLLLLPSLLVMLLREWDFPVHPCRQQVPAPPAEQQRLPE
jgi:hypothetical protein